MSNDINTFDGPRPALYAESRTSNAGQALDMTKAPASFSRLDTTACILAAVMALAPLAMAAWGAHFGTA